MRTQARCFPSKPINIPMLQPDYKSLTEIVAGPVVFLLFCRNVKKIFYAFQWIIEISRWNRNRLFHCFKQKIQRLDFHCLGLLFLLYFMNSRRKILPKTLLAEITATTLTFRDRTADVTYCADITLFCTRYQVGCHWLRHFFCANFLRVIALNAILAHFLGARRKNWVYSQYYSP